MPMLLEARQLTCAYNQRPVLSDINLTVRPGEVLALLGQNGAGKTTLLRALGRLLRPVRGTVQFDGRSLWATPPRVVARRLAFAPQLSGSTWPLTVAQVVALGRAPHRGWLKPLSGKDRQVVQQVMEQMGVERLQDRLLTELSGGEQRRVILARALAQQPAILLLDEPTAHLDLKYQFELLTLVRSLAHDAGLAIIMSLHDLHHAAMYADTVALLSQGHVLAHGSPLDVLVPQHVEAAYGVPVMVTPHPIDGSPLITPVHHHGALQ